MNLTEKLKLAIENEEWSLVIEVYEQLGGTESFNLKGEKQQEKKQTGRTGKKKKRDNEDFVVAAKGNVPSQQGKRRARSEPINSAPKNMFKDDLNVHANELVTKNPKLGVQNPMARGNRGFGLVDAGDTSNKITVKCCLCGVVMDVSPALAYGYSTDKDDNVWKCNDCCTASGRNRLRRING